ncbi:unnamed protein product [Lathyrus oleraceus]
MLGLRCGIATFWLIRIWTCICVSSWCICTSRFGSFGLCIAVYAVSCYAVLSMSFILPSLRFAAAFCFMYFAARLYLLWIHTALPFVLLGIWE